MTTPSEGRCIYCLETKPNAEFDRDHVVPEAFGSFVPDNLVVRCVCRSCNNGLGRTIEEKMSRDTLEGLDRVRHGLKKASEWKSLGRRSTLRVEFDRSGPLKGAVGYHVPDPTGDGLAVTPAAMIGLGRSPEGPFEWFAVDQLPPKAALLEMGYERGTTVYLQFWGIPFRDVREPLEQKGYNVEQVTETPAPRGRVRVDVVGRIGDPEFRVVSKIALNYVAATAGPGYALMPNFNAIRRFILEGVRLESPPVRLAHALEVVRADGTVARAHYVSVHHRAGQTIAQVSLFSRLRYVILLSDIPFLFPVHWETAHVFDLEARKVAQTQPPPLA